MSPRLRRLLYFAASVQSESTHERCLIWLRVCKVGIVMGSGLPHLPKDLKPAMTKGSQRAGARHFALSIGFGALWINRKNAQFQFEQTLNGPLHSLSRRRSRYLETATISRETAPSRWRYVQSGVGRDLSAGIEDDHVMVIFCPIEAGIMCDVFPCFHK